MNTTIKLLALDMDGTTLTSDKTITKETAYWIRRAISEGITVSFATGRGEQDVVSYIEELGLTSLHVLLNGSLIRGKNGEVLETHYLKQDLVKQLYQLAIEKETWYWGYSSSGRKRKDDWEPQALEEPWFKFGFRVDDKAVIEEIRGIVADWDEVEVTSSEWNNVEINPKGVTKAAGVKTICKQLGLSMGNVMAIGDSLNDYPLFMEQDVFTVAMGNADPKLKQVAKAGTASNDEDGVAKAIKTYIFGE